MMQHCFQIFSTNLDQGERFGHSNVSILDGGISAWTNGWSRDTETGFKEPKIGRFVPNINNDIYADKDDVLLYLNKNKQLIDARSSDKYLGINSSTDSMRKGTIPGAINIPNILTESLSIVFLYFLLIILSSPIAAIIGKSKESII